MTSSPAVPALTLPDAPNHINPELYIDRELSWIAFNQRVLEEVQDARNPLLERVNFLSIFSANLDEFFMIRVSGVKKQILAGVTQRAPSGLTPIEQFQAIRAALLPQLAERQRLFQEELLPALHATGIHLLSYDDLTTTQHDALRHYYEHEIFPVLTPLAIDASHPFPFISNLNVNLLVVIDGAEEGRLIARVKVPEGLPRLVRLPTDANALDAPIHLVLLEDIIAANLGDLFPGKDVVANYVFRVTRDTDLTIQEDEALDLLETVEDSIRQRPFGTVVRLSLDADTSPEVRDFLMTHLEVGPDDVYTEDGPLRLSSLTELNNLERPDLKYPSFVPTVPALLRPDGDMFAAIRQGPILLHHPFDSFTPIIDLVRAAARDPQVLAIKQTLYRVGRNSPIVAALVEAREEDKQVAAVVELKARFDEENNIEWAREMEKVGVHTIYGISGLKTHAKMLIIVRKEDDGIRRYVHLGTGNYNASTAHGYTDMGLLTTDDALGADLTELFNVLTGYSAQTKYRRLLVAPHELRPAFLDKIDREIAQHERSGNGHLIFKFNALTDEDMIMALYRASQAGVQVDLIIRGMCCLRPGIPGLSETIQVRSIIGRFLEHNRIYYFHNGGAPEIYLGSADLMDRNLDRRVETLFPIEDERQRRYLHDVVLKLYLQDNTQARVLHADGTYTRLTPGDQTPVSAQQYLLEMKAPL